MPDFTSNIESFDSISVKSDQEPTLSLLPDVSEIPMQEPSHAAELAAVPNSEPNPYPTLSQFLAADLTQGRPAQHLPTINNSMTSAKRDNFVRKSVAPHVVAMLEQPFGKETIARVFTSVTNLRLSYPDEEIYLGDDDVSGAFRHVKYHPNVVGMHSCVIMNCLLLQTGQNFGDNTSPSNWEVIARTRQQLAQ